MICNYGTVDRMLPKFLKTQGNAEDTFVSNVNNHYPKMLHLPLGLTPVCNALFQQTLKFTFNL